MQRSNDHEMPSPKRDICNTIPIPNTQKTFWKRARVDCKSLRPRVCYEILDKDARSINSQYDCVHKNISGDILREMEENFTSIPR